MSNLHEQLLPVRWFQKTLVKKDPTVPNALVLQPVPFNSLSGSENTPAFSPDGKQIAYVWNGANEDNDDIYIQAIGSGTQRRLTSDRAHDGLPVALERIYAVRDIPSRIKALGRDLDSSALGLPLFARRESEGVDEEKTSRV